MKATVASVSEKDTRFRVTLDPFFRILPAALETMAANALHNFFGEKYNSPGCVSVHHSSI